MRKSLGIMILLLALLGGAAAAAGGQLAREGTEVEIEETALLGDRTAADGLRLGIPVTCWNMLCWDTEYTLGTEQGPVTEFRFIPQGEKAESDADSYFMVQQYGGIGASTSGGTIDLENEVAYGLGKVLADVAGRTAAGEEHTEQVSFRDYYQYYPLTVEVMLGGNYCGGGFGISGAELEESDAVWLVGDIQIPVSKNCTAKVSIIKNQSGGVDSYELNLYGQPSVESFSAVTEDMLYYAVYCSEAEAGEGM